MRMAIASARWRAEMSFDLDAEEVFTWATSAGAQALRGHDATGTLAVGAPADLILLDPQAPNLRPVIDGHGLVVHSGSGANVTDVMVNGAWVVRGRTPTRVNAHDVIDAAQKVSEGLWARARA
jgi:5-methylthioadenosine/S-adenosylhomocysteine deaminase